MSPADEISYDEVVVLTRWMANHDFTPEEMAYAVEKPAKHIDLIERAKANLPPADET